MQKHWPLEQTPQQQSSLVLHLSVGTCDGGAAQLQKPFTQELLQQSASRVQAAPRAMHWQVRPPPLGAAHTLLQQVLPVEQEPPLAVQVLQLPLSQRPLQQSASALQLPVVRH